MQNFVHKAGVLCASWHISCIAPHLCYVLLGCKFELDDVGARVPGMPAGAMESHYCSLPSEWVEVSEAGRRGRGSIMIAGVCD